MAQIVHIAIIITIFAILAMGLNIALGFTGLINLGHVAFFGIGAYTSAILAKAGVPFLASMLFGGLLASVFGFLLTFITRKLKGDYFALATLGFAFIAHSVFLNWKSMTGGPLGIRAIPRPDIFGFVFKSNELYLLLSLVILAVLFFFLYRLTKSRYGKLLAAVRDDALGVAVLGKSVFRLQSESMMVSAFVGGIAGSLYAHYINFIDPSTFFISDIVILLTIVIVGGLASLRGSVVAAIIIILIPELLRFLDLPDHVVGAYRQIMYTLFLLAILLFKPRGLFGKVDLP